MRKFFKDIDFQGWVFLLSLAALAVFFVLHIFGWGNSSASQETEPPNTFSSDAFDILWYASEDITFLDSGESWRTADFEVTISDILTDSYSKEYPGIAIDLEPFHLSPVDAFCEGTLQFYLYAMDEGSIFELLSDNDFLAYADAKIVGADHGRATLGIPDNVDCLLVIVVVDGSIYRAAYTPG